LVQLDGNQDWNWWLVFSPFWIMTFLICYANYLAFAEVQKVAAEKDPTLFGNTTTTTKQQQQQQQQNDVESSGVGDKASSYYGSLGDNGFFFGTGAATSTKVDGTPASSSPDQQSSTNADGSTKQQQQTPVSPLTEEEREELKAQVMASSSRLCSKCCFQGFILFIFFLFVAKLQGAGFSAFLIISPFLLIVSRL
jgi:Transmembrane Fragile-X-F protein